MPENHRYKLYIGRYTVLPEDHGYSYFSPASGYLLLYTADPPGGDFREVPPANEYRLAPDERQWLRASRFEVNRLAMERGREDYCRVLSAFLEAFDDECRSALEQQKGGATGTHAGRKNRKKHVRGRHA